MMSALAKFTCKAFIERLSPQKRKRLSSFLPNSERVEMEALKFANPNWINDSFHIDDALDVVHPSWIISHIQTCTPQEIGFFLASLQPSQASALRNQLHYLRPLPSLTFLGKTYLRKELLKTISDAENIIPFQVLPESHFNSLAKSSFKDLVQLDIFLGLKDLSQYFRQVIDKTKLKNIEQALAPDEWQTVQQLSLKKDPLFAGRQGFDSWDGRPEKLRSLIEQRGINRLAKALFGEHPSLLWYVTHIFDVARASFFQKVCTESPSDATRVLLQEQVIEALKKFQRGH